MISSLYMEMPLFIQSVKKSDIVEYLQQILVLQTG